jgi:hypothetical protein
MAARSWVALPLSVALALAIALPCAAHDENIRAGVEFQVNIYTVMGQAEPSVAMDADGDFVVSWYSYQDGSSIGIFARRFSRVGDPVGVEFQVNAHTTSLESYPDVASDADGDFVVAWQVSNGDGNSYGVFARRFSSSGSALGLDFQVNVVTIGAQKFPTVAAAANGAFVVVWELDGGNAVFARRFSSSGAALGSEIYVNERTTYGGRKPTVAMDGDGDFIVTWTNFADLAGFGVFARRFSSAGAPLTADFQVNTYTFSSDTGPEVASEGNGDFVVAWYSDHDGYDFGIFARRFSSAGSALGGEFQVNTRTLDRQWFPSVASDADGDFIVAWDSGTIQDGSGAGVFAQRYSSTGLRVGGEFQVNTFTVGHQSHPAVASDADGDFVVAWSDTGQDGSSYGIFAQLFDDPILADVDGNGVADPLTDGLLLLRYMFGFRGLTLITGAVDLLGCKRCNVPMIEAYLAEITN